MNLDIAIELTLKNKDKITYHESIIKTKLDKLNLNYIHQYPVYDKNTLYIIDFYLPEYNCYIEVDGESHLSKDAKTNDYKRKLFINNLLKVREIRIKNSDCENINLLNLIVKHKTKKKHKKKVIDISKIKLSKKDRILQYKYNLLKQNT